jgi:hypothetical protein
MTNFYDKAIRLQEMRLLIMDLVYEAENIVCETDIEELADRTWLLQLKSALDNEHGRLMKLYHTMEDSELALFEAANASDRADFCERVF